MRAQAARNARLPATSLLLCDFAQLGHNRLARPEQRRVPAGGGVDGGRLGLDEPRPVERAEVETDLALRRIRVVAGRRRLVVMRLGGLDETLRGGADGLVSGAAPDDSEGGRRVEARGTILGRPDRGRVLTARP